MVFQLLNGNSSQSMFPGQFQPVLHQSIIQTLAGQSKCYSHNSEHQGGKPLLPVLKTLVCRSRKSNPRPPAHKANALTTRLPWRCSLQKEPLENKLCLWNTDVPKTPIFWETWPWYLNLTFADDIDLCTRRCVLMRCAFIPNMSLASK